MLALPLFDTTLVFVSRLRRGRNPLTTPGKDHVSHRLVASGMTRREAVLTCYLLAGLGGVFASYIASSTTIDAYVAGAGLLGLFVTGIVYFEVQQPG